MKIAHAVNNIITTNATNNNMPMLSFNSSVLEGFDGGSGNPFKGSIVAKKQDEFIRNTYFRTKTVVSSSFVSVVIFNRCIR